MFRPTRSLLSSLKPIKASTNLTGLAVHPDPLPPLCATYTSTLNLLSTLPSGSVYRQATEALLKHKLKVVESAGDDVSRVESELGGMVEQVLGVAKGEQRLAGKMMEWKAWEPLEEAAPAGQWRYFEPGNEEEALPR